MNRKRFTEILAQMIPKISTMGYPGTRGPVHRHGDDTYSGSRRTEPEHGFMTDPQIKKATASSTFSMKI